MKKLLAYHNDPAIKEKAAKRKPKFRVDQVVCINTCITPAFGKIARISTGVGITYKIDGWRWLGEYELRPLTAREQGPRTKR